MTLQEGEQPEANPLLVVDDEDATALPGHGAASAAGISRVTSVPAPGALAVATSPP